MSEPHLDIPVPCYGAQAAGGRLDAHSAGQDIRRLDEGTTGSIMNELGGDVGVMDSGIRELGITVGSAEVVGHIVGVGPDREITDDFRYQYGHTAVALSDRLARTVIEEDISGGQRAREQLAAEVASLRKDFAIWEAGLKDPKSDEYFEATGIVTDFNLLDRPHLPVILTHEPVDSVGSQTLAVPGSPKAEIDGKLDSEARQRLFSWLRTLSDERLVNYFQWSEARTDAVTNALASQRDEIEQNVRRDFERLITDGLVPESARDALERSFKYTAIFGALSSFESGFYQAGGFYDSEARRIGVHREYGIDEVENYKCEMHWVFLHESLHAYDAANDTGLTYLLNKDEEPLTWVDEAVKEHLAEAGMNGQAYVLDPGERYVDGIYKDIRELLYLVLTGGELDIDLRDIMAANFELLNAGDSNREREKLVARLGESYRDILPDLSSGGTVVHVIAKEINAAPKPLQANVIQEWIQKVSEWRDESLAPVPCLIDRVYPEYILHVIAEWPPLWAGAALSVGL